MHRLAPVPRGSVPSVARRPSTHRAGRLSRRRAFHAQVTWAVLAAIVLLLAATGWLLGGAAGALVALAAVGLGLLMGQAAPDWALRSMGARPLGSRDAPELVGMLADLSRRAGLASVPRLHVLPRRDLQAFAAGEGDRAAVALSAGLLETLTPREVAAVLAHEVSHLSARDTRLMRLAGGAAAAVRTLSLAALMLAFLAAPVPGLMLLALAPLAADLLWLRLSREREYAADAGAAELTGDPEGLARALGVLSRVQGEGWEAQARAPLLSRWLRTHPFTRERIRRLMELAPRGALRA